MMLFPQIKDIFRILYLSITSKKFYYDVAFFYKKIGLFYIFSLIFFSAFITTALLLYKTNQVLNALQDESNSNSEIRNILNQIPDLYFDGTNISLISPDQNIIDAGETNLPISSVPDLKTAHDIIYINITNSKKNSLIAIDTENKIAYQDRKNIPIIFAKDKLILNLGFASSEIDLTFLKYNNIFGNQALVINQEYIKNFVIDKISNSSRIFIYFVFPWLTLQITIIILTERIMMMLLLYVTAFISKKPLTIRQSIRLSLFSVGITAFTKLPIELMIPQLGFAILIAQLWCNILMFTSIFSQQTK